MLQKHHEPPLLRTCKQARHEGRNMFYANSRFQITLDTYNLSAYSEQLFFEKLHLWLQHIGPEACASLRGLEVKIGESWGRLPAAYRPRYGEFFALMAWHPRSYTLPASSVRIRAEHHQDVFLEQGLNEWVQRLLKAGWLARQEGLFRCSTLRLAVWAGEREVTSMDARWAWASLARDSVVSWALRTGERLRRFLRDLARGLIHLVHMALYWLLLVALTGLALSIGGCMISLCVFCLCWLVGLDRDAFGAGINQVETGSGKALLCHTCFREVSRC